MDDIESNHSSPNNTHQMSDQQNDNQLNHQSNDKQSNLDWTKQNDHNDLNKDDLNDFRQDDNQINEDKNYLESDAKPLIKQERLDNYDDTIEKTSITNDQDDNQIVNECKQSNELKQNELVLNDELEENKLNSDELIADEQLTSNEQTNDKQQTNGQSNTDSYTDFNGVNLEEFLFNLLQNNAKDRIHLLKIEQELINLVKDENRTTFRFPPMSSYHRMLVHRVAAYFGLDHNIDPKCNCVIVNKQDGITRIPELRFKDQIKQISTEEPKKLILKRNTNSMEDGLVGDRADSKLANGLDIRKTKSFEERNEHYEKVKARIFNQAPSQNSKSDGGQSSLMNNSLSNIDENDLKCNSIEPNYNVNVNLNQNSNYNHMNGLVNDTTKSNHHNFDSGHSSSFFNNNFNTFNNFNSNNAAYLNSSKLNNFNNNNFDDNYLPPPHHYFGNDQPDYQFNAHPNSQFNNHCDFMKSTHHQQNKLNSVIGDVVDCNVSSSGTKYYKSNGFKGKSAIKNNNNNSIKNSNKQQTIIKNPAHYYQQPNNNLPSQLLNSHPFNQQQLYPTTNWIPATDLNAQQADCYAKQLYQPFNYNQIAHPNQQKLFLLCNPPPTETHSFSNDKMVPNPVVLQHAQPNNTSANNKMDKENLNTYVTAQMSNLSLGSMNADINDVQGRTSTGIPICYIKPPYYSIPNSNQLSNDVLYQNSLAQQRAHLPNQQMLLLNPNSILPHQQSIGMTNNQRFTNPSNYPYTVDGSTSHLEMNQMYPHMPHYLMPNTIRQPLLPTPVNAVLPKTNLTNVKQSSNKHPSNSNNSSNLSVKKKLNADNHTNEQMNGFIKNERKKANITKTMDKKSPPNVLTANKPKSTYLKGVNSVNITSNGTTRLSQSQSNNGLSNKVV